MNSNKFIIKITLIIISLLLLDGNIIAQQNLNLDFHRERALKFFESDLIIDTINYPLGDTLTIIQRPLLNIPTITTPGDTIKIECEADVTTTGWGAKLSHQSKQISLDIVNAVYDPSIYYWIISARVPSLIPTFELYDLVVTADGGIIDTTKNAVRIIPEYKDEYYFIHITDTHLPTHLYYYEPGSESDTSEIQDLREVIKDINIINPEFVLLTGDFINEGELEDYLGRKYYSRSQRLLTEFETPVYLLAGNHDIGGWVATPMPNGTARRNWWKFFGWKRLYDPPPGAPWYTQNYSFDYGPVHYIGLEAYRNYDLWRNNIYGDDSFTSGQLQWLTQDLANSSSSISQVLFYHYDFSDQINVYSLDVEMAIWGHTHSNSGTLSNPPYNISTRSVCNGNRSYRLVRISNGILYPSLTISAGQNGNNLNVQFQPANNGQHYTVTAHIENYLDEDFEHSELKFIMPNVQGNIDIIGGELLQVDDTDSNAIYYVGVNILPNSAADITVILDPSAGLPNAADIPKHFALNQNYPNPFNPATEIKYQIPELSFITLKIYDVLGSEITTLVNEDKPIGTYTIDFDASNLPSGVYFYQLRAGDFVETKKMVLVK